MNQANLSVGVGTVFAPAWRAWAAAGFWQPAAPRAASACPPDATAAMAVARLKRRPEFLAVAASGLKLATPAMIVQARRRGDDEAPRLGLTASRKVGGAVERNRARRRLRAAAEAVIPLAGRTRHDYVLVARTAALTRPYALLVEDFTRALGRLASPSRRPEDR